MLMSFEERVRQTEMMSYMISMQTAFFECCEHGDFMFFKDYDHDEKHNDYMLLEHMAPDMSLCEFWVMPQTDWSMEHPIVAWSGGPLDHRIFGYSECHSMFSTITLIDFDDDDGVYREATLSIYLHDCDEHIAKVHECTKVIPIREDLIPVGKVF